LLPKEVLTTQKSRAGNLHQKLELYLSSQFFAFVLFAFYDSRLLSLYAIERLSSHGLCLIRFKLYALCPMPFAFNTNPTMPSLTLTWSLPKGATLPIMLS